MSDTTMPVDTTDQNEAASTKEGAAKPQRTIAVIDGNSLMHRAFHAIRQPMAAPDGTPTGALFGFFNMFIKLVESFSPDGVICAFDKGKPQVRIDMLPQYKAQRPPMDPALHAQFPIVKELLKTLDVPVCQLEGWEGDDILGTLARRGEAEGYQMLLFTGDRDMYQLSTENVKIVSTRKGVSDVSIMTPETVADLYAGITPELVPDFYGLKGDSSDNIPGVPGIGPKKAAALIVEYGSLDQVIAHADEVKGKVGENLRAHIDDALLSRKVATIRTDAPLDINLDDAKFPTFDPNDVVKAFSALGFTGMTLVQPHKLLPLHLHFLFHQSICRQETHLPRLLLQLRTRSGLALLRILRPMLERSLAFLAHFGCLQKRHFLNLREKMQPQHSCVFCEKPVLLQTMSRRCFMR